MNKPIYKEIHFIRAIACLLVIMVHVTGVIHNEVNGIPVLFNLILNQLSRLGTPIFAVLSAFLLFSSVQNRGFQFRKFFLSRTTKVIFPFIIWTTVYVSLLYFKGWGFSNNIFTFIFSNYILGEGFYHLYFIITIIQFYMIFPILQLARNKFTILLLFIISLPLNYLFLSIREIGDFGGIEHVILHRSFILNWISYFLLGAVMAYYFNDIRRFCKNYVKTIITLAILVLIGVGSEIKADAMFTSARPMNLIYIPVFTLFLITIYQFFERNKQVMHIVNIIGRYSMGLYLIHPLVIIIVDNILPTEFWSPQLILVPYTLVIISSTILVKLILLLPMSNYIISVPVSNDAKKDKTIVRKVSHVR